MEPDDVSIYNKKDLDLIILCSVSGLGFTVPSLCPSHAGYLCLGKKLVSDTKIFHYNTDMASKIGFK